MGFLSLIRFGLYGSPLDPVLFDIDPPQLAKAGATTPTTYASVTSYSSMTGFSMHSGTGTGSSNTTTASTGKPRFVNNLNSIIKIGVDFLGGMSFIVWFPLSLVPLR